MSLTDLNIVLSYILIIDDDADDHVFLRNAIHRFIPDTLVESVYDGQQAMDFLSNCNDIPSVIFLDLNMPRLSGEKTIKLIKENPNLKNIPIVIFTVSRSLVHRVAMLEAGASAFYSKPASQSAVDQIVMEVRDKFMWSRQQ